VLHALGQGYNPCPSAAWLIRGYTGHEMLPQFGLINMNARLYDPIVGRMLSPDNYVQAPSYSQSYNRFSYVFNNPLKYTDPTGNIGGNGVSLDGPVLPKIIAWAPPSIVDPPSDFSRMSMISPSKLPSSGPEAGLGDLSPGNAGSVPFAPMTNSGITVSILGGIPASEGGGPTVTASGGTSFGMSSSGGGSVSNANAQKIVSYLGIMTNLGQETMFSNTFNTWMGKDFKIRPQTWGGNGLTGGKFKFARSTSTGVKGLGGLNYLLGVYNAYTIHQNMKSGQISKSVGTFLQADNIFSTLIPPIYSIPKAVGGKLGEAYADEIADFSQWLTDETLPIFFNVPTKK